MTVQLSTSLSPFSNLTGLEAFNLTLTMMLSTQYTKTEKLVICLKSKITEMSEWKDTYFVCMLGT